MSTQPGFPPPANLAITNLFALVLHHSASSFLPGLLGGEEGHGSKATFFKRGWKDKGNEATQGRHRKECCARREQTRGWVTQGAHWGAWPKKPRHPRIPTSVCSSCAGLRYRQEADKLRQLPPDKEATHFWVQLTC